MRLPNVAPAESGARKLRFLGTSALVVALVLLILTVWIAVSDLGQARAASFQAAQTRDILERVNLLLSSLKDAEAGQRGYLLTGEEHYLEPYSRSLESIRSTVALLVQFGGEVPEQKNELARLRALVPAKLEELEEAIQVRKNHGPQAALAIVLTDRGRAMMEEIRVICDRISTLQYGHLNSRARLAETRQLRATIVSVLGTSILFLLIILGVFMLDKGARLREELISTVEQSRQLLQTTLA